jgi:hypothetical protein
VKNSFAPINRRIPPELFSLIPRYMDKDDMDENLIALTHTCHSWRELLIACPSLWTRLDFADVDKTRVYIERAKSSPLEVVLYKDKHESYLESAFLLAVPHIRRLKSLTVGGTLDPLQNIAKHFSCPTPLLEELTIDLSLSHPPTFSSGLFFGDPFAYSVHTLFTTLLPSMNTPNLTTFKLHRVRGDETLVTQLLDLFKNAPLLSKIALHDSFPTSSNAPPEQVVSLPHLRELEIDAEPVHSILLNHLSIPAGASLIMDFGFTGDKSPLRDYLPKTAENLKNISRITAVNLHFDGRKRSVRLHGSDGGLYMFSFKKYGTENIPSLDSDILRSLDYFTLWRTRALAITEYELPTPTEIESSAPYHILHLMKDLHTLTLTQCNNLPFILVFNPDQCPSKRLLCPKLEELVLYVGTRDSFNITELMAMAKGRASGNKKLSSITIVGLDELLPGKEVFKLGKYVTRVEYRFEEKPPKWDDIANR